MSKFIPMKANSQFTPTLLALIGIAALGVFVAFLYFSSSLVNNFFIALIIVITAAPVMSGLKKCGIPAWAAYLLTVLILVVIVLIFVVLIVGAGKQFLEAIPELTSQTDQAQTSLETTLESLGLSAADLNIKAIADLFDLDQVINLTGEFVAGLVETFSDLALIGILILFMLVDAMAVPSKLGSYFKAEDPFILRLSRYTELVRRYIGITTIVGAVTGILDTILFLVVGVEFALLWGILAFVFSFIPTIGFWIALIPPVTLAYLQFGLPTAILLFLGIVLINGFAENIVKPRYMGIGLDLSFFTVFFSVVFWSAILGSIGAILSIPLTLAFKVLVLEADESGRWFFDLISDRKRREKIPEQLEAENLSQD